MKTYKLIIFDLDDTLFDYVQTEKIAVIKTCNLLGINSVEDIYAQYKKANGFAKKEYKVLSNTNIKQFRELRAIKFLSLIHWEGINPNMFIEEYLKNSTLGILIEGVKETLNKLSSISKVVATNGSNYPRLNKLKNSQISVFIDDFFSSENLKVEKPNPEFFTNILCKYNLEKEDALMVGDDFSTDILGAINSGIDCCWFNYRKVKIDFNLPESVIVIEKFNELLNIVNITNYE